MKISPITMFKSSINRIQNQKNYTQKISFGSRYCTDTFERNVNNTGWDDDSDSLLGMIDRQRRVYKPDVDKNAVDSQMKISKMFNSITIKNKELENSNIASFRQITDNNFYTGSMRDTAKNIGEIQNKGIKKLVVLCRPEETTIEKACKDNKINYQMFYVPEIQEISNSDGARRSIKAKLNEGFVKLAKTVREGNSMMGCESGNQRTGMMLGVLSILDPKCKYKVDIESIPEQTKILSSIIFENLSKADKTALGYTDKIVSKISKTLYKYL